MAAASDFTGAEMGFIDAMGPWPPTVTEDPSNAWSGQSDAIAYGEDLFFDTALSKDETISCAHCHSPDMAFADGLPRSQGTALVDRNAPALANLRTWRWFGWDGRSDTLWEQSIHPIVSLSEMALNPADLPDRLDREAYRLVFGAPPAAQDNELVLANVGKALAAYQETLVTRRTPFDDYRDHLLRGAPAPLYPEDAADGLKLFVGRGQCVLCHFGPAFTNGEFHDIGLPYFVEGGRADKGRYGGLQSYLSSPYTFTGPYSDAPEAMKAQAPGNFVDLQQRNWGEFRVPSLRNVASTAPYMHDGSLRTLEQVVRHYSDLDLDRLHLDGESLLRPLELTDAEVAALVSFLETLTSP